MECKADGCHKQADPKYDRGWQSGWCEEHRKVKGREVAMLRHSLKGLSATAVTDSEKEIVVPHVESPLGNRSLKELKETMAKVPPKSLKVTASRSGEVILMVPASLVDDCARLHRLATTMEALQAELEEVRGQYANLLGILHGSL